MRIDIISRLANVQKVPQQILFDIFTPFDPLNANYTQKNKIVSYVKLGCSVRRIGASRNWKK